MEMIQKHPLLTKILLLSAACAGLTFLYFVKPGGFPYPPCVFHDLTGLYCPGCGSTRALYQLLHGNILAALHDNIMAVLAVPFFAYAIVRKEPLSLIHPYWIWGLFYALVAFTVLRNIPLFPFTYLAPLH
jgi:hypothetical protein